MREAIRVFDAFQFSEAHEVPLLLAKLTIEEPLVERWVIVENTFTHKGDPKEARLRQILDEDHRFAPFRDRIDVVRLTTNFVEEYRHRRRDWLELQAKRLSPVHDDRRARTVFEERPHLHAEQRQRDAALAVVTEVGGGAGWVVVSDIDEFLDVSKAAVRDQVVAALRTGATVTRFRRQRFNYDIDNFCPAVRFVGCASVDHLRRTGRGLQSVRTSQDGLLPTLDPLVFEYSFCYPRAALDRKLATYIHTDPGAGPVDIALECNHGFFGSTPTTIDIDQWYAKRSIEELGAPDYVLDHAAELTTGNVNPDYAEARLRRYPHLFTRRPRAAPPTTSSPTPTG